MNTSVPAQAADGLLFRWESPRRRRAGIVLFLAASVLAHAFCFYVFQIVYPPTVTLLPPPARVSLITSNSEEGRSLLRWIDAEDPALAFTTLRPVEGRLRALPKIGHVPSYTTNEPTLRQPPPLPEDIQTPSSQPPARVATLRPAATPEMSVISTAVSFSEEFKMFGAASLPSPKFVASTNEPPQSIRFRIAVDDGGEIRYCFPLSSSGDGALDQQAHDFMMLVRFPLKPRTEKDDRKLSWAMATINWGNDIAPAPSSHIDAVSGTNPPTP